MKFVIDAQQVESVVMVVGKVELPLTREQVVQMLYGDEWKLVPTAAAARLLPLSSKQPPLLRAAGGAAERSNATTGYVLDALSGGGLTVSELRAAIDRAQPGVLAGRPATYLSGTLTRMHAAGQIARTGSKGSFVYSARTTKRLPAAAPAQRTTAAEPGAPTFLDLALRVLDKQTHPVGCDELRLAIEKQYPGQTTSRHASSVAAALVTFTKQKLVKRTGTRGLFRYVVVQGWKEKRAARAAALAEKKRQPLGAAAKRQLNGSAQHATATAQTEAVQ